jgi:hypothetical protein
MVDVEAGQIYSLTHSDGELEHFVVLHVDEASWTLARTTIHSFEKNVTHNVHARTLWRMCERIV